MLTIKTFAVNMVEENTYVVSDETRAALIVDCGAYSPDEREALAQYIEQEGLTVTGLINTHGHFDHVFGLQWAAEKYGVELAIAEDELDNYRHAAEHMVAFMRRGVAFDVPQPARLLHEGDTITLGNHTLRVIATPGHTPGGICFYDENDGVIFTGDSLFQANIGRCDLPGGDLQSLVDSLQSKVLTLPEEVVVYPGHGPTTTVGFERINTPYL